MGILSIKRLIAKINRYVQAVISMFSRSSHESDQASSAQTTRIGIEEEGIQLSDLRKDTTGAKQHFTADIPPTGETESPDVEVLEKKGDELDLSIESLRFKSTLDKSVKYEGYKSKINRALYLDSSLGSPQWIELHRHLPPHVYDVEEGMVYMNDMIEQAFLQGLQKVAINHGKDEDGDKEMKKAVRKELRRNKYVLYETIRDAHSYECEGGSGVTVVDLKSAKPN